MKRHSTSHTEKWRNASKNYIEIAFLTYLTRNKSVAIYYCIPLARLCGIKVCYNSDENANSYNTFGQEFGNI